MKPDAISIDIETLGKKVHAPVVSIGAVQFNRSTGKLGPTFYREINIDSALKAGSRIDGSTICWWMQQEAKARRVFSTENKTPLSVALDEFRTFCLQVPDVKVYGNGATFDIGILEYAYEHGCVGLTQGWHFMGIRDMRTIMEDAGMYDQGSDHLWPANVGTHHNALDDAIFQAKAISIAWQRIKTALSYIDKTAAAKVYDPDL